MNEFGLLLEKELAVRTFDYPEDDGTLEHGSTATERILSFGTQPYAGAEKTTNLLHAIDLNTLTPQDIAILTKPEYLTYAWESDNPRERRDRLEKIINAKEGGDRGHELIYGSGPAEMRKEKKIDQEGDEYLTDYERPVKTSSYKTYDAGQVDGREFIVFDLDPFRKVLGRLNQADDEYTFENLSDDYLRQVSETGEAAPIRPDDILYGEPEDHEKPTLEPVVEPEITPKEIEKAPETKEVPEPEIEPKFEPDTDIETGKIDSKFEPEVEIEPRIEPEPEKPPQPKKIELEPDIEKAISRRVETEIDKKMQDKEIEEFEKEREEPEIETAIEREIEKEEELEEPETEDIEESINRALGQAKLI